MAKKLKKHLEITVPLYGVVFMCFPTVEAETKFIDWENMSRNHCAHVSVIDSANLPSRVVMTFRSLDEYCTEALAHECVHAAWKVLELVGVKSDVDNQETLAYLTGWIARQVNNFMIAHVDAAAE